MQDLHSDPNLIHDSIDGKSSKGPHTILVELRAKALTVVWALAVLVATAGWLYFIARIAWLIVNWLSG
jgi:hypothetical protein